MNKKTIIENRLLKVVNKIALREKYQIRIYLLDLLLDGKERLRWKVEIEYPEGFDIEALIRQAEKESENCKTTES